MQRQQQAENRLRAALRRALANATHLDVKLDAARSQIRRLQFEVSKHRATANTAPLPSLDAIADHLQNYLDKISVLEREHTVHEHDNRALRRKLNKREEALATARQQVDALTERLSATGAAHDAEAVRQQLSHAVHRAEHAEHSLADVRARYDALCAQYNNAQRALSEANVARAGLARALAEHDATLDAERRTRHEALPTLRTVPGAQVPALLKLLWPNVTWLGDAHEEIASFERLDDFLVTINALLPTPPPKGTSVKSHKGVWEYDFNHGGNHGRLGRIYFHQTKQAAYVHNKRSDKHQQQVLSTLRW